VIDKAETDELSQIPTTEEWVPDEPVVSEMEFAGDDIAEREAIQELARINKSHMDRQATLLEMAGA